MGVLYSIPLRGIAQRAGMLRGDSTPGIQASYNATPLTQAELGEGPYSLTQLKDCLLEAEEQLANAIANVGGHPFRSYILSFTAALSNGDVMPSTDMNGVSIIGIYGSVLDGADQTFICTEWPTEIIRRWMRMQTYYKSSLYGYALDGNGITHTRDSVVVQVCVYSRSNQETELEANNDMLLPDVLENALVCGGVSMLAGVDNAPMYRQYFNDTIAAISRGLTSVPNVDTGGGATLVPAVSS